ncbi:MAG: phosphoribosylaminoimidazole carboxylase [Candidatus Parcubacteria bacterium]|jgi:phosphoribosylaminoimidazole-succinocarboxamide synthase
MRKGKKLAEGKTKIIWEHDTESYIVLIESKDDITAGDGARHDVIANKGVIATTTTVNCFMALAEAGVRNHFINQCDERTFEADKLQMIPIEIVIRWIATGSYLKRRPDVAEGTYFPSYVVEFFRKDDAQHDPLMIYDLVSQRILYFDPKKPLASGFIEEAPIRNPDEIERAMVMRGIGIETFEVLEDKWAKQGVTLVDLKIECGTDEGGGILVGDVIDNDSWRIWPGGDKSLMKDKQVYRELAESLDPAAKAKELGRIKDNFAWVAEQTAKFV